MDETSARIRVTGDCGHKFEIPWAELEGAITCPVCGKCDRIEPDQIPKIKAAYREALDDARGQIDDGMSRGIGLADVSKG